MSRLQLYVKFKKVDQRRLHFLNLFFVQVCGEAEHKTKIWINLLPNIKMVLISKRNTYVGYFHLFEPVIQRISYLFLDNKFNYIVLILYRQ